MRSFVKRIRDVELALGSAARTQLLNKSSNGLCYEEVLISQRCYCRRRS